MPQIGIDPGAGGGIAWIDEDGTASAVPMPKTDRDIWELLAGLEDHGTFAMLECVRSSPQMGVVSSFSFGRSYGQLRMALTAAKIPYEEVTPGVWQRDMKCSKRGNKTQTQHKNALKRRAQELFPELKITHATADALLIAEHCRRCRALQCQGR
jgi:hypothetical protein